jgi:hypothetical protein
MPNRPSRRARSAANVLLASFLALAWPVAADVSEDGVWESVDQVPPEQQFKEPWIRPQAFHAFAVNPTLTGEVLAAAPLEGAPAEPLRFWIPMPDGAFAAFDIVESPIMAPELQARFPSIRTYLGRGVDDPGASVRFDWTPHGFHAQILSPEGAVYVDPFSRGDNAFYTSYYKRDYTRPGDDWSCTMLRAPGALNAGSAGDGGIQSATVTLRTYRLANACTGEYASYHGGTTEKALAAIVTSVNRVSGVYEVEVAVRMQLVANNDQIVFLNGATDPYTNNNGGAMLQQNQNTCDSRIGSANYDIGHVFSTGGGGVAYLNAVCNNSIKAQGVTGSGAPKGDAFDIDYVAHEVGHQFGGDHTFNGCGGGNGSHGYEPGSGSTIQAYAGICGSDDLQPHSDPVFHHHSLDQINSFIKGGANGCAQKTDSGNTAPTVSAGPDFAIPIGTPFTVTAASAFDADGDTIYYSWEQHDIGPPQGLNSPDNGKSPIFRCFKPTTSASRTFPQLSDIIGNKQTKGEKLPTVDRTMTLRCSVRDNDPAGGGTSFDEIKLAIFSSVGPFLVTSPNTNVSWSGSRTVEWDVAGTDGLLTNTKNVRISLSTDGGLSFPIILAESIPNTGAADITLPDLDTTKARVKVEALNNIYWDMSNANFTITPASCYADCNKDGALDLFDFLCFTTAFNTQDPYADCDHDGGFDLFDFLCYQGNFAAGCD